MLNSVRRPRLSFSIVAGICLAFSIVLAFQNCSNSNSGIGSAGANGAFNIASGDVPPEDQPPSDGGPGSSGGGGGSGFGDAAGGTEPPEALFACHIVLSRPVDNETNAFVLKSVQFARIEDGVISEPQPLLRASLDLFTDDQGNWTRFESMSISNSDNAALFQIPIQFDRAMIRKVVIVYDENSPQGSSISKPCYDQSVREF